MTALEVWTDGACAGNPGPGGWAWITNENGGVVNGRPVGRYDLGGHLDTTNQRMEQQAVLSALITLRDAGPLVICSDSRYVVDAFAKKWWRNWERNNWRNREGQPVANRDLWEPMIPLATRPGITLRWVKGHAGNGLNEAADRLAVFARDESIRRSRGAS